MQRIFTTMLAAGLCVAAAGCIAVVKGDAHESKPKPMAATPVEGTGTLEPATEIARRLELGQERVSAEVRYRNDTSRTLRMVTIWCRALDKDGYQLEAQRVDLTSVSEGPMGPGFKAKRDVSFLQSPGAVTSVACEVVDAK